MMNRKYERVMETMMKYGFKLLYTQWILKLTDSISMVVVKS